MLQGFVIVLCGKPANTAAPSCCAWTEQQTMQHQFCIIQVARILMCKLLATAAQLTVPPGHAAPLACTTSMLHS
jgi:hypothetical protein